MPRQTPQGRFSRRDVQVGALLALVLAQAGCAPRWDLATYDRFALNGHRSRTGGRLIRVVALVPGGGELAEAIGAELARRGFVIVPVASTLAMAEGVDFRAVAENHIPDRRNPGELWKLRNRLQARDVDAFLIVRAQQFAPREYLGRRYWQQAALEVHSTTEENASFGGAIAGTSFANLHQDRASSAQEAAAEMVNRLAMGPGAI